MTPPSRSGPDTLRADTLRADALHTRGDTLRVFLANGSPRIIVAAVVAAGLARVVVGSWHWLDLALIVVTVVVVGLVEWTIHRFLLHAPADSFRMRVLKTGTGHREHHLDPDEIRWILLSPRDAALFVVLIALGSIVWSLPTALALGAGTPAAHVLTAVWAALVALANYEWTHLLLHTRYRPRNRLYRRLVRNHRLHHFRNERFWLGVTSNVGDRLLGTLPRHRSDVPLSDTARSLA